jgi:hypothetical protein
MTKENDNGKFIGSRDLAASITQTAANKLLNSVSFPFTLLDITNPPPGNLLTTSSVNDDEVKFPDKVVKEYLNDIIGSIDPLSTQSPNVDSCFYSEALSNLSVTIESAKAYLTANNEAAKSNIKFEGPEKKFAQDILDAGIEGFANVKGIEFKAICSKLRVIADNKPDLALNGNRIGVSNSKIITQATGELWWYHPTFHCSRLCTRWSVTWGWDRVASLSVSLKIDLDGYVEIIVNGKVLTAKLNINKLRLDYPILKEIPLEVIANRALAHKQLPIFDAGNFIACLPVINSRFSIDSINIPIGNGSIDIEIAIREI